MTREAGSTVMRLGPDVRPTEEKNTEDSYRHQRNRFQGRTFSIASKQTSKLSHEGFPGMTIGYRVELLPPVYQLSIGV